MMLADEHELWLQSYDGRYLKKWKDLFRADIEAAMGEAEIRRRLQNLGSTVEPNEDLNTGKAAPDFRCSCSGYEFFVEVACITIAAAEDKTGISDGTPHRGAVRMLNQAIFQKCVKKARQAGFVNAPVLVAVGTWHNQAAMEFSDMAMLNTLLTGDQLHTWGFNAQTGEEISPHQSTNLYPAIFLKHDEDFHAMPAREPISGLLLCAFGMPGIAPVILLNPNACRPFQVAALPDLSFGMATYDRSQGFLSVHWTKNADTEEKATDCLPSGL